MGLQWKSNTLKDDEMGTFDFGEATTGHLVGISGFQLCYNGKSDYEIMDLGVTLEVDTPSSQCILVTPHLILDGKISGHAVHSGDTDIEFVIVTVVAWVGGGGAAAYMAPVQNLCSGPQNLPPAPKNIVGAVAALTSFKMGYTDGHHNLSQLSVYVDALPLGQQITVTGSAEMEDQPEHKSNCLDLAAGVLASLVNDPQFEMQIFDFDIPDPEYGKSNTTKTQSFGGTVTKATAILTSFSMTYETSDHHLFSLVAGAMTCSNSGSYTGPAVNWSGDNVTVTANLNMRDSETHDLTTNPGYSTAHQTTINRAKFLVIASFEDS